MLFWQKQNVSFCHVVCFCLQCTAVDHLAEEGKNLPRTWWNWLCLVELE